MSQIMKTFLGVFLIMFMVVTSSGVPTCADYQ